MLEKLTQGSIVLMRAVIKAATGFIIVPLGIFMGQVKDGWESASLTVKIFTGILLLPLAGFLRVAAPWWQDFDIVD